MFRLWSNNDDSSGAGLSITDVTSGALIGHVTLFGATLPARSATLAILIGPEFVGQGYGTDAVRTMVDFGFRQLGLHRIQLTVWAFNVRALRAYTAAGFREEGRRREVAFFDGSFHDQIDMSVLEHEWPVVSGGGL